MAADGRACAPDRTRRSSRPVARLCLAALLAIGVPASAQTPLSAIDWLSDTVAPPDETVLGAPVPGAGPLDNTGSDGAEPFGSGSLPSDDDISISVLGAASPDAIGLFPAEDAGIPRDFWRGIDADGASGMLRTAELPSLPALRALWRQVLLAEIDPPTGGAASGGLLRARADRLLEMGAIEQADALLGLAGSAATTDPELFRRYFDTALLLGTEAKACEALASAPGIAPTIGARVFCLVRSDDWSAAALTLNVAQTLGRVEDAEAELLARFLDPALAEEADGPMPVPARVTPLTWRMFEAIGEPLSTATLPLAFAHADMAVSAGWKSRIVAAERLVRSGVVAPDILFALYAESRPAASGGVWERARAIAALESALAEGATGPVGPALDAAWAAMHAAELEVALADQYADSVRAASARIDGDAQAIALRLGLLAPDFRDFAATASAPISDARGRFMIAVALGNVQGVPAPDALSRAIAPAFGGGPGASATASAAAVGEGAAFLPPPGSARALISEGRHAEGLFAALANIDAALQGDPGKAAEGLTALRLAGFETAARQAALQLLILDRRG
jgi:hypothetical protein